MSFGSENPEAWSECCRTGIINWYVRHNNEQLTTEEVAALDNFLWWIESEHQPIFQHLVDHAAKEPKSMRLTGQ